LGRLIRAFCRVRIRGQIGNDLIDCKNDIGKKQKAKMAIIADVQGIEKNRCHHIRDNEMGLGPDCRSDKE
tara:strand:+ start:64116 stop:64325 length:210 start_codon:yes stop_codon:yes gene_type:complete